MGNYHKLYLKADLLLQLNVFERSRKTCLDNNKSNKCYCFSSPGLSFDATPKMTPVVLQLISDIDKYQSIGMGAGICCITKRCNKANSKYMLLHDESKSSVYIHV